MNFRAFTARCALTLSCILLSGLIGTGPAAAQFWQCAPYAREVSGIQIRGNANTWWGQAAGRYQRGNKPRAGAILSFASSRRMPVGHVAMVSRVISDREVLLTHANWSRPGAVETDVRAIDVSSAGDWSSVKVWYGPIGDVGTSANAANGFIYADRDSAPIVEQDEPIVTIATVNRPVGILIEAF